MANLKYDKLIQSLSGLKEQKLSEDFDKKFWQKFEQAPVVPMPPMGAALSPVSIAAIAAPALVACVIGVFVFLKSDMPQVNILQGESVIQSASKTEKADLHRNLKTGDRIKTGPDSWVVLEVENGYRIKVQPGTELTVKQLKPAFLNGKTQFKLDKGQVLVSIGDQIHRKYPLEIMTPNAFARAMGTQFLVSAPVNNTAASQISVLKGVVQVGNDANTVNIKQGEQTFVGKDKIIRAETIVESKRLQLEEAFQFSKRNRAILLLSMSPDRYKQLLKPCAIYIRFEVRNATAVKLEQITQRIMEAQQKKDVVEHLVAVREMEAVIRNQNQVEKVPLLLFVGAYYNSLKEYSHAVRIFTDVSLQFPNSSFASLALMAKARILETSLGKTAESKQITAQILRAYPDSPEAKLLSNSV